MIIKGDAYSTDRVPDPAYECENNFENCVAVCVITIEILYDDGERLKGKWSLEGNDRQGQFNVIKCNDPHPPCG